MNFPQQIEKHILIQASPEKIWSYLTNPELMQQWMGDPEMRIEILSDWKVGGPFVIKGFHHAPFENRGTILQFEPGKAFQYEYLSSLSNLEDEPENYTVISFYLAPKEDGTELCVEASNFPTVEIYKHWEFYWNGTLQIIKWRIENFLKRNRE
ncbi:SRPBCC domain-containing protein [Fluviicola sp.]|uniref:SRPBCC family protein n=1 Tax=Fluviicola sp. TaxID=1917219 RepID=UPI0031CF333B